MLVGLFSYIIGAAMSSSDLWLKKVVPICMFLTTQGGCVVTSLSVKSLLRWTLWSGKQWVNNKMAAVNCCISCLKRYLRMVYLCLVRGPTSHAAILFYKYDALRTLGDVSAKWQIRLSKSSVKRYESNSIWKSRDILYEDNNPLTHSSN